VLAGAAIIGIVQGMVPLIGRLPVVGAPLRGQGSPELVLGVLALVVMALRGVKLASSNVREDAL
jgi:hypothetical protein